LAGDQVDPNDLAAPDRKAERDARPSARSPHGPRGSVDQRRLREPCTPDNVSATAAAPRTSLDAPTSTAARPAWSTTSTAFFAEIEGKYL
jgi:hypothetical protein